MFLASYIRHQRAIGARCGIPAQRRAGFVSRQRPAMAFGMTSVLGGSSATLAVRPRSQAVISAGHVVRASCEDRYPR